MVCGGESGGKGILRAEMGEKKIRKKNMWKILGWRTGMEWEEGHMDLFR